VGNYPDAVKPATEQLKELTKAIIDMKMAGKEGSEEYQQMLQKAGELKDAMGDAQQEINQMASDTSNLDSVLQGAQVTAGAFSTALGVLNLVSDEDSESMKELAEIQKKLQSAIAITTGLQSVQNALQKNSALMMGIQKIQTLAAAKAQDAYSAATGRATIAQRIFNGVAKSNPYVLLATVILSVVGALFAFNMGEKETEEQTKKVNDELSEQIKVIKALRVEYDSALDTSIHEKENEIALLKAQGASLEKIRAVEDDIYSLRAESFANQKADYADIIDNMETYENEVSKMSEQIKKNADQQHEMYADLEKLQDGYYIDLSRYPMLLGKSSKEQLGILQGMYDTLISSNDELIGQLDTLRGNINTAKGIMKEESDSINERNIQLEERRKEDQKRAKEAAEKQAEITRNRNEELRKFENEYNQMVIDQSKQVAERYEKDSDEQIAKLKHRLETDRKLTVEQRAELNRQIIDLELEKNLKLSEMNLENETNQLAEELRLKQQSIDDTIKQLEKEGVITAEIRAKYEEKRKQNEQDFNNAVAQLVKDNTIKNEQFRRDAYKQTLETNEEETISSYERLNNEYELKAKERLLLANGNELLIAEAEVQNATDKYNMLVSLDAEAKELMFQSEEEYKVAVEEAENDVSNAVKRRINVQMEGAKKQMQSIGQIFDTLSGVMADYAEESEEAAAYEKILSLAKISMATGVAIAEGVKVATDSSKTWYEAVIAIATMVATVIANTASAIKMVNSAKFAGGGIVGGDSYSGDKVNAQLNSGEMVLNREQQANLFRMIDQPRLSDNTEQLTVAFATALSEMPNPILDYSEFTTFTNGVNERTNKTIIR
jgi:hypothetical protein